MTTSKINNYFTKSPEKQPFKRKATTKSSTTVQSGQKIRPNGSTPPIKSPEKDTSSSPKDQDHPKDTPSNSSEEPIELPKALSQSSPTNSPHVSPGQSTFNETEHESSPTVTTEENINQSPRELQGTNKRNQPSARLEAPTDPPSPTDTNIESGKATEKNWKYEERRILVSLNIDLPDNAQHRLELLAAEVNSFLEVARKQSKNHLRMMSYNSLEVADAKNKKQWIRVIKSCPAHFEEYTHGYYPYQKLRKGTYRIKLKVAVPLHKDKSMTQFIESCSQSWGNPEFPTVKDLPSQSIYNHKKLGWFLRSTKFMGHTRDLQDELEFLAKSQYPGLHFGLSFQTIPDPNNGPWDPFNSTRAIGIETNEETFHEGWAFLHSLYNKGKSVFPLGAKMSFVGSKDHPDYKNDFTARQNIGILMKRQKIFEESVVSVSTSSLIDIDIRYQGTRTLRHRLMELNPKTLGPNFAKAKLFHSIDRAISRAGVQSYHFTFHQTVSKEASNIVSSICEFIRDELKINPDFYCFQHKIRDGYSWDPVKRTSNNPSIDALSHVMSSTLDLDIPTKDSIAMDENSVFELGSKGERERDRMMGLDDTETVEDMKKKKVVSHTVPSSAVFSHGDDVSAVTDYTSSTKASTERKKLRSDNDEKDKKIAELEAQLKAIQTSAKPNPGTSSSSESSTSQISGERSVENISAQAEEVSINSESQLSSSSNDSDIQEMVVPSPSAGLRFEMDKNQVRYYEPETPKVRSSVFVDSSDESEESSPEQVSPAATTNPWEMHEEGTTEIDHPASQCPPKRTKPKLKVSKSMINKAKQYMQKEQSATRGVPGDDA